LKRETAGIATSFQNLSLYFGLHYWSIPPARAGKTSPDWAIRMRLSSIGVDAVDSIDFVSNSPFLREQAK
jgi:hypothetical protein